MSQSPLRTSDLPRSVPALMGLIGAMAATTAMVAAGLGSRFGWWHFTAGLRMAEWAAWAAAAAVLLSVIGLFHARPGAGRRGLVAAALGLLVAAPPVAMAMHWELAARRFPPINDISTDTLDAPVFWDMPNPTDYPGARSAQLQHAGYPDLATLKLAMPVESAFRLALEEVEAQGWAVVTSVPAEGRIEATATSLLYGFTDEVIVRVSAADGASKVDMRSRSRLGRVDRGANAARIRTFTTALLARAANAAR